MRGLTTGIRSALSTRWEVDAADHGRLKTISTVVVHVHYKSGEPFGNKNGESTHKHDLHLQCLSKRRGEV
jgi:hypothetical protein